MHWSEWPYRATIRRKSGNKSIWKWYHTKLDILMQIANWAAACWQSVGMSVAVSVSCAVQSAVMHGAAKVTDVCA